MNFPLEIIQELEKSDVIKELVNKRMRAFVEPNDKSRAFIIVSPVEPETPVHGASNNFLGEEQHHQIDVQSYSYDEVKTISKEVRRVMNQSFNMYPQSGGVDSYFEDTRRYLISIRYIGTPHKFNYKSKII